MRTTALALLLVGAGMVLTLGSAASAASPNSGSTAFMQLFATACAERSDYDAAKAAALAAGWVPAGKGAEADLQAVLKQTRALQNRVKVVGSTMMFEAYAKQADDHRYGLVLASTRGRPGQPGSLDCSLYDFTAGAPVDPGLVEEALEVTAREHEDDRGASFDAWSLDGTPHSVTLAFIPPESELAGTTGYSGASLIVTTYAVKL